MYVCSLHGSITGSQLVVMCDSERAGRGSHEVFDTPVDFIKISIAWYYLIRAAESEGESSNSYSDFLILQRQILTQTFYYIKINLLLKQDFN